MSWEAPFSHHAAEAIRAGKQRWDRRKVSAGTVTRGRSGDGENPALSCDSPFRIKDAAKLHRFHEEIAEMG
jgi:hypothetical protein